MGTTADKYSSAVFLNKQILLVTKIVRDKLIIYQHIKSEAAKLCILLTVIAGKERKTLSDLIKIICENNTLIKFGS